MPTDRFRRKAEANPFYKLARQLVQSDARLIDDLVVVRKARGLSQAELAEKMGITQSAVARFESGERNASQATIRRYAMAVQAYVHHKVTPVEAETSRGIEVPVEAQWRDLPTTTPWLVS